MQARVGKKRSITRAWWSSGSTFAGLLSIVALLFLAGCATRKIKNPSVIKSINSICLTGQGKGRIEFSKGRHVFDYESLWEPEKDKWSLALGLPLIGQELLALSMKGDDFSSIASGTFANRLKNENKSPRTRKLLGDFFAKFVEFLKIIKTKELPKKKSWKFDVTEEDFVASTLVGSRYEFYMKAFQWNEHYERIRISMNLAKGIKSKTKSRTLLKLDLFVGACNLQE